MQRYLETHKKHNKNTDLDRIESGKLLSATAVFDWRERGKNNAVHRYWN